MEVLIFSFLYAEAALCLLLTLVFTVKVNKAVFSSLKWQHWDAVPDPVSFSESEKETKRIPLSASPIFYFSAG